MTVYELHINFEIALDKASSGAYPDIPIEQRNYFLNIGYERFIKQRYNGLNVSRTSFEETQKRRDDLAHLVKVLNLQELGPGSINDVGLVSRYYDLPDDYWMTVGELVNIKPVGCATSFFAPVFIARHFQVATLINDPFNKPKKERVFSLQEGNVKELFYDPQSVIVSYELRYLSQYKKLAAFTAFEQESLQIDPTYTIVPIPSFQVISPGNINVTVNNVNLTLPYWKEIEFWASLQSHQEIIDLAVKSALEAIESPRQQTFNNEVLTTE